MEIDFVLQLLAPTVNVETLLVIDCRKGTALTVFFNQQVPSVTGPHHAITADLAGLPFREGSFDAIFLCGVVDDPVGNHLSQEKMFLNFFLLLRADGILLFAADNKYSPAYLVRAGKDVFQQLNNAREQGRGLKIKLMANAVRSSFLSLKSCRWYEKLLSSLGFTDFLFFGAPKGYDAPCILSDSKNVYTYYYNNLEPQRRVYKRLAIKIFDLFNVNAKRSYSYIIICKKSEI